MPNVTSDTPYRGLRPIIIVPGPDTPPPKQPIQPWVMSSTSLLELLYEYNRLLSDDTKQIAIVVMDAPTDPELEMRRSDCWYAVLDHPDALRRLLVIKKDQVDALIDTLLTKLAECKRGLEEHGKVEADIAIQQFLTLLSQVTGSEILRHIAGLYDAILRANTIQA